MALQEHLATQTAKGGRGERKERNKRKEGRRRGGGNKTTRSNT
jgi:hypothetical protein